ncbi:MFS transporter [Candidatus Peregrinibacteria bacterium]|nr:MAG: MFS transporter [Candidatus Peregrinibacteria bacterium]
MTLLNTKNFPTSVRIFILAIGFDFFAWGFLDPFFSLFSHSLLKSFFLVGLITALKGVSGLFALGPLLEWIRVSSAPPVALFARICTLFAISFYAAAGIFFLPSLLFIGGILQGIGNSARDVSCRDFLMESSTKENASTILGTNFSFRSGCWILTAAFSGIILLLLSDIFSTEYARVFPLLCLLVCPFFIVAFLLLRRIPQKTSLSFPISALAPRNFFQKEQSLFRSFFLLPLRLQYLMLLICFLQVIQISLLLFLPILANELKLSLPEIGFLMATMFCPLLFSALFSVFEDRTDRMLFIIGGLFFAAVPLLILSQTTAPLLVGLCAVLISLSLAVVLPANLGSIAAETSHEKAPEIASLQILFQRFGTLLGAFFTGFLSQYFGIQSAFFTIAGITVLFALCAVVVKWYLQEQTVIKNHPFHIHPLHPQLFHIHHVS